MTPGAATAAASSLDPRSPAAADIAELWWVMLALGAAVYLLVVVLLVIGLRRRGDGGRRDGGGADSAAGDAAGDDAEVATSTSNRWIGWGGVALPVLILTAVFGFTVETMRATDRGVPQDALVIEVVGHQWWWSARYPDHGIVTATEIHIPVGRPVAFRLTSADVIHSLWVPSLDGKLDLLPERTNTLVVRADQAGRYQGRCAEFCGVQHAKMPIVLVADQPDQFATWLAAQQRPAAARGPGTAAGQDVFREAGCASCHTVRGTPAAGTDGPDLTHLASRMILSPGVANADDALSRWILDPHAIKEGVGMPATSLSEADRRLLVAYLRGLD
ncbi:MAG: cytochrome c oxidase subunit II [Ilumatobacteraceae bacterium]